VTPEEAFAEYQKTRLTFNVRPAFVDGWRMGRDATVREVEALIDHADDWERADDWGDRYGWDDFRRNVRALLDRDA
jgi:hypothetical protein